MLFKPEIKRQTLCLSRLAIFFGHTPANNADLRRLCD
jgi:hypothetical protein